MNQDNDGHEGMDVDPQVSAHYEKFADEKTPADLDRAVMHEARRAVRADNRGGSFGAWFRPVAFMTTVGLSLAIILDLNDAGFFSPPADMSFETAPPGPVKVPDESAADAASRNLPQMTVSEVMRQKKSAAAQSPAVDAPDNSSNDAGVSKSRAAVVNDAFTAEIKDAEQRVEKTEAAVEANLQSRPGSAVQFTAPQATIATESHLVVEPVACSNEQKSAVEEWWKCIETLRKSGLAAAADLELERLREDFPEFEPPE